MSTPDPSPSLALWRDARAGRPGAWDRLFARVAERVRFYVEQRMGPALRARLDPLDVLQDTYVEALGHLEAFEFRGEAPFAAWLCCIAENRMRALAAHHGAAKRRAPGTSVPVSRVLELARDPATGPVSLFARAEHVDRLRKALGELAEEEREALLMRYFQESTLMEIAHATGRSETAVRRLLGRAMSKVGGLLAE